MIKKTLKYLLSLYDEEKNPEELSKELLRQNLSLVSVDIFYIDDPLLGIPPDKRLIYLKKFFDLCSDPEIMEWFKYLINKQVRVTMQLAKDGIVDASGAMNINGIATVKDQFEKLANTYLKENITIDDFNKHNIL